MGGGRCSILCRYYYSFSSVSLTAKPLQAKVLLLERYATAQVAHEMFELTQRLYVTTLLVCGICIANSSAHISRMHLTHIALLRFPVPLLL